MHTLNRFTPALTHSFLFNLGLAATLSLGAPVHAQISFTTSQNLAVYSEERRPALVLTGDLDGDGDLDLAAVSRVDYYDYNPGSARSYLIISLNQGDGTFTTDGQNHPIQNLPRDLALGDLDGDGDLDLVTSYSYFYGYDGIRYRGTINILKNRGDGYFGPEQAVLPVREGYVVTVAVGDLDGDQDLDLVTTANLDFGSQRGDIAVLLNNGKATFTPGARTTTGRYPIDIAVGDLDGDGDLDVVVANQFAYDVSVLLNNGNATFTPGTNFAAGRRPEALALGDLDGDTDLEIVVTNASSRDLSVLENNGAATFAPPRNTALGGFPEGFVLGDFDQDTDLDVAVTISQLS